MRVIGVQQKFIMDIFKETSYQVQTGYKIWESKESDTLLSEVDGEVFTYLWTDESTSNAIARGMLFFSAFASMILMV